VIPVLRRLARYVARLESETRPPVARRCRDCPHYGIVHIDADDGPIYHYIVGPDGRIAKAVDRKRGNR